RLADASKGPQLRRVQVQLNEGPVVTGIVDTGSEITLIPEAVVRDHDLPSHEYDVPVILVIPDGRHIRCFRYTIVALCVQDGSGRELISPRNHYPIFAQSRYAEIILGLD